MVSGRSYSEQSFSKPWAVAPDAITYGCRTQNPHGICAGNPCLQFYAMFSASVSRRPYFAEHDGGVMVSTAASLAGVPGLTVSAQLESPAVFLFSRVALRGGATAKLPFRLEDLPTTVRTSIVITLHLPAGPVWAAQDIIKRRRFERIPPTGTGTTTAVDHETGALLLNGQQHLITGMYVGPNSMLGVTHTEPSGIDFLNNTQPHTQSFTAQLERLARGGCSKLQYICHLFLELFTENAERMENFP